MKKIITLLAAIGLAFSSTNAQVGIGTASPDASSALEIKSTDKGFLLPRMTNAEMKAITSPAEGLMVFNTDFNCVMVHVNGSYNCVQNPLAGPPTKAALLGSTYVDHFNGNIGGDYDFANYGTDSIIHTTGEVFSANGSCDDKPISVTACNSVMTVTGKSGIEYNLVEINGQCWMQDNLQEVPASFASFDGTYTTRAGALGHWGFWSAASGSYGATVEPSTPKAGFIYTWNAAMDNATAERSRGACPQGFHIPSDCEIMFLEHGLGMSIAEQERDGNNRGTNADDGNVDLKLRNPAIFNLFNVGHLNNSNSFGSQNNHSMWTSTLAASSTTSAFMRYDRPGSSAYAYRSTDPTNNAFSVRCLKD